MTLQVKFDLLPRDARVLYLFSLGLRGEREKEEGQTWEKRDEAQGVVLERAVPIYIYIHIRMRVFISNCVLLAPIKYTRVFRAMGKSTGVFFSRIRASLEGARIYTCEQMVSRRRYYIICICWERDFSVL